MKKALHSLLTVALIACSITSFAAASDTLNQTDGAGKRQGWWIITGAFKKDPKYAPSAKVEEGRYKDSQKTGVWIEYYPNGAKKSELTFVNNRPNGHAVMYHENGKKSEEGTWVGTRWVGDYTLYYEDGVPRQQFNYNQLGKRDGKQVYYHPNGKVAIEVNVKEGKEEGWKKEYNENGELIQETYFAGGNIDPAKTKTYEPKKPVTTPEKAPEEKEIKGTAPTVTDNANKPNTGQFTGEGYWILYKNGQISMKGTFKNRKLMEGEERVYDNNGKLMQIKLYKGGKYVGDGPLPVDSK
jgi:antitoxin component YwqK of YwqJK toxin-antitoxin module